MIFAADLLGTFAAVLTAFIVAGFGYLGIRAQFTANRAAIDANDAKTGVSHAGALIKQNTDRIEHLSQHDGTVQQLADDNAQFARQVLEMAQATSQFTREQTAVVVDLTKDKAALAAQLERSSEALEACTAEKGVLSGKVDQLIALHEAGDER